MASFSRRLLLIPVFLFTLISLQAQSAQAPFFPARERGWWTLGLNGGIAWQSADVRANLNKAWGGGLTLGKNLFYRPGGAFSFDWRGRFLISRTNGLDLDRSFGILNNEALNGSANNGVNYRLDRITPVDSSFVFHNYRHTMGELGIEGVLTFNRLRERTGIVFSLFGGFGLDAWRTRLDQLDDAKQLYNYFTIDQNAGRASRRSQLAALRDGDFETPYNNMQIGIMPGAGLELGFQVTPRFMIGLGHKITFSLTDELDGQVWTNDNTETADNDWHHYTNLHLRWILSPGTRTQNAPPEIEITRPNSNPYSTYDPQERLNARIRNVRSYTDIQCTINGLNQSYSFRNGSLEANVRLRPGRNEIRIVAGNPYGRAEASQLIFLEERRAPSPPSPNVPPPPPPGNVPPQRPAPQLQFTQPNRTPFTSERDQLTVVASVNHVRNAGDLRLLVNGVNTPFTFNADVRANIYLRQGRNIVRIEAETPDGRAADEVEINYQPKQEPPANTQRPVVRITNPAGRNTSTSAPTYNLKAECENVSGKSELNLILNGSSLTDFNYDTRTRILTAILKLRKGSNEVKLIGRNRYGEAEAQVVITQEGGISLPKRPEVNITEPSGASSSTDKPTATIKAATRNVDSRNNIVFEVNGQGRPFDFNAGANAFQANIGLQEGDNKVVIKVTNSDGSDFAETIIRYRKASPPKVTIVQPQNNSETRIQTVTLVANTEFVADKNQITVYCNGQSSAFEFQAGTGKISGNCSLNEGENTIRVAVKTPAGSHEASAKVRYIKSRPPRVTITAPSNGAKTQTATSTLTAKLENVSGNRFVEISLNGTAVRDFTLDKGGNLSAKLNLAFGKNTIRVKASNTEGSDEASVLVTLEQAAPPASVAKPTVKFNYPEKSGITLDKQDITVRATVGGIKDKKQLNILVNGLSPRMFSFEPRSGLVTIPMQLKAGNNTVSIEATNEGGVASARTEINYLQNTTPLPDITIESASQPTTSPFNPNEGSSKVLANTRHIQKKEQISIKVNDTAFTNFNFDPASGKLDFVAKVKRGTNQIVITVTNTSGSDTDQTTVLFD